MRDAAVADSGELCLRWAAIQCEGQQRCCGTRAGEVEICRSDAELDCIRTLYLDDIAAEPAAGFDDRAAERIWAELERHVSECDASMLRWLGSEDGLRGIFRGTRRQGEPCNPEDGVFGDRGELAAALSTCRLEEGLACQPSDLFGEWACAPRQAAGGECLTDDNCRENGACNNFSQAAVGSCITRQALGASCMYAGECESLDCRSGRCMEPDVETVFCSAL